MGIFSALRAWFGGRPSVSVMSLETMTSADPIPETTAIAYTPEPASTEAAPVAQFDYSPVIPTPEAPAGPATGSAIEEVYDAAPVTATAPTIVSSPSIWTTEDAMHVDAPAVESTPTSTQMPKPTVKPPKLKPKHKTTKTRKYSKKAKRWA